MKTITNTFCPCFPGFYESVLSFNDDYICESIKDDIRERLLINIKYKHNIDFFDLYEVDYKEYEKDVSIAFCAYIEGLLYDFDVKIEYQNLVSPREYNFSTDSIN